ncbi:FAD-dependent monooxygenase [Streptomyces iconiensis]|uniref:FAD-dependent monooxygenase n=1 Tax=Streptomyces iconiensis TaxID=1384038 RepID=A0ABT7AA91_9ACTN|nr:FAD-dependent monooxygenase [Streptomyces iconiensis]MDJ1138220.1 FAD-dependent monooxygenase [Streptomyces iconiensis]
MSTTSQEPQVLVVGGAVTGLSTAVFLGWHGIRTLVVERHPDTLSHPRSRGVNPRTVELYRQVGLEEAIWSEASLATDFSKLLMIRAETLAGPEMFSGPTDQPDPSGGVSPCEWAPVDQDRLEHLLRERAVQLGAELSFATEMVSFEQSDDGVTAVLRDTATGAERTVRSAYLVAADGSRSPIREELGIETDGPGEFATTLSVLFEADLSAAARGREVGVCYLDKPAPSTILFAHDGKKRWIFATAMPEGATLDTVTEEQAIGLVRDAIGQQDLDVRIVPQLPAGGAKWLSFVIGAQVAREYRRGRVFLVGDAAHLVPPTGGFGASLGIQDAGNLAWKLAAVLDGESGPELLDTYQSERHPVAWMTLQQALGMMQERTGPDGEEAEGPDPAEAYSTTVFGYRYGEGPVVPPQHLRGEPGTRAPHVVFERNGSDGNASQGDGQGSSPAAGAGKISTLDLYGRAPVVLTGEGGQAWVDAAREVSAALGITLDAHRVQAPDDAVASAHGIAGGGAVLVRPDGFVAWRATEAVVDPQTALREAVSALYARS